MMLVRHDGLRNKNSPFVRQHSNCYLQLRGGATPFGPAWCVAFQIAVLSRARHSHSLALSFRAVK